MIPSIHHSFQQFSTIPSAWALIIVNTFPIFGVLFLDYDILSVFLLYWAESGIIAIFVVCKMIATFTWRKPKNKPKSLWALTIIGKIIVAPFLMIHFAGFMFGHLFFIIALFSPSLLETSGFNILTPALSELMQVWLGLLLLSCSHGFSFYSNFIKSKEYKKITKKISMMLPYKRIVIMHITLIIGGMLYSTSGQILAILLFLIVVKIGVDLYSHMRERKKFGTIT